MPSHANDLNKGGGGTLLLADDNEVEELDRLRLQLQTLQEEYQANLDKARNEAREEAAAARGGRRDEGIAEISEVLEITTLNKEMAEEKVETLQLELELVNEKNEILELELASLKGGIMGRGTTTTEVDSGQVATVFHAKHATQAENEKLREALVRLRDISAEEKHSHQNTLKENECIRSQLSQLLKSKQALEGKLTGVESELADLQEQYDDAAMEPSTLIESLTERNLDLEEKVAELAEAVVDLEELQTANEQLLESAKAVERELRQELDEAVVANQNTTLEKEALVKKMADCNNVIFKFRDLVQELTNDNQFLRQKLETIQQQQQQQQQLLSSTSSAGLAAEALDFKKLFVESRNVKVALDLEVSRLEHKSALLHVQYLTAFMPEGFTGRKGDNDAILVALLISRIIWKVELLQDKLQRKKARMPYQHFLLCSILGTLRQWAATLSACPPDSFLAAGELLLPEVKPQELLVDLMLDLLGKGELEDDDNGRHSTDDGMERVVLLFRNLYSVHLKEDEETGSATTGRIRDTCLIFEAAGQCIQSQITSILEKMKQNAVGEQGSTLKNVLQEIKTVAESIQHLAKQTVRDLPERPLGQDYHLSIEIQVHDDQLDQSFDLLFNAVKLVREIHKATITGSDDDDLSGDQLDTILEAVLEALEDTRGQEVDEKRKGGVEHLKTGLETCLVTITDVAKVVKHSSPSSPPVAVIQKESDQIPAPLLARAQTVKKELELAHHLRLKLNDSTASMRKLRSGLQRNTDELKEVKLRKELAEAKLARASKDRQVAIDKISVKLQLVSSELERTKRELQLTTDYFLSESESSEAEKGELKKQLNSQWIQGLKDHIAGAAQQHLVTTSDGLVEYTRHLQRELWQLRSRQVVKNLKHLPPLNLNPLSKKENHDENNIELLLGRELRGIRTEWSKNCCEAIKIALNPDFHPSRIHYLLRGNQERKLELVKRFAELKYKLLGRQQGQQQVVSRRSEATASGKQEPRKIGTFQFSGEDPASIREGCISKRIQIVLSDEQLGRIQALLRPLG